MVLLPVAMALEVTTDEWGRFPVSFNLVDNTLMPGYAALDLFGYHFTFSCNGHSNYESIRNLLLHEDTLLSSYGHLNWLGHHFTYACDSQANNDRVIPSLRSATGVSIGSNGSQGPLNLSFNHPDRSLSIIRVLHRMAYVSNLKHRLYISATPDSALAQSVSSFLMTPNSTTQGLIVFNPENPENYAFGGQLFYSPIVRNPMWGIVFRNREYWAVNTAIRFTNETLNAPVDTSVRFIPCLMGSAQSSDPSKPEIFDIPARVIQELLRFIAERGIQAEPDRQAHETIHLINVDDATIDSLPTLQFIIRSENDQPISVANLSPREYMVPTRTPNKFRLLFAMSQGSNFCSFNKTLRNRMVIHFDTRNNRVGFGDPLVEL